MFIPCILPYDDFYLIYVLNKLLYFVESSIVKTLVWLLGKFITLPSFYIN